MCARRSQLPAAPAAHNLSKTKPTNVNTKPSFIHRPLSSAGDVPGGLQVHPDREHLIYPLGSTVVVEKIAGKKGQSFLAVSRGIRRTWLPGSNGVSHRSLPSSRSLQGHTNSVSAIAISRSGRYVASGQVANAGVTVRPPILPSSTRP